MSEIASADEAPITGAIVYTPADLKLDAPLSSSTSCSPRLAESAAPAAFCCAADFAGISISLAWLAGFNRHMGPEVPVE